MVELLDHLVGRYLAQPLPSCENSEIEENKTKKHISEKARKSKIKHIK